MRERKARPVSRMLQLLTMMLGGGRYTIKHLAGRFGVTERTIYRDLKELQLLDYPVYSDDGVWALLDTFVMKPVQFTKDEVVALTAAIGFAKRGRALNSGAARSAMEKLLVGMPSYHREVVAGLDQTLVVEPVPAHSVDSAKGVETNLTAAIQGSHPVRLSYQGLKAEGPSERVVHPYGLAYRGPALYLIGYCELRKDIRTFRANRILSATVLPAVFRRPADFDLEEYLDGMWSIEDGPLMNIRLRFSRPVAKLATETKWNPTQVTESQTDGSVVLTMQTRGMNELARWLVGFGGTVEVLEPAELRSAVIQTGREITDLYSKKVGK